MAAIVFNTIGLKGELQGAVARSDARTPGMRTVPGSIFMSGEHYFVAIWSRKKNVRPFPPPVVVVVGGWGCNSLYFVWYGTDVPLE